MGLKPPNIYRNKKSVNTYETNDCSIWPLNVVALEVHDSHMAQPDTTDFPMTPTAAVSSRNRYPEPSLPLVAICLVVHLSLKNQLMTKS